ncbi:MAG: 5'-nucleotidase C-terminal domain-containing protein [Sphingobacteriaceae bacterium]|nr:5'-nucleotidase C-terminal domain-containing protein [Sphingobacteriaceae bacterium]
MKRVVIYWLFLSVFIQSCHKHLVKTKTDFNYVDLQQTEASIVLTDSIKRYKTIVDHETSKVIAIADNPLTKTGNENTLGNFVCDAMEQVCLQQYKIKPDITLVNRGGLRVELPKGEIKKLHLFELMPFENQLVVFSITGKQLMEVIALIKEYKHSFKGMRLDFTTNEEVILINELKLDTTAIYKLLTSDYIAEGGDNFKMFGKPSYLNSDKIKLREALIQYCIFLNEQNKHIIPYTDGRYK